MKAIASNACFEVALRDGKMRRDFWQVLMKGIVKTGELPGRRKCVPRRSNQGQGLGNVQGSEMGRRPQLLERLRRDLLVGAQLRPPMNDSMSHRERGLTNMSLNRFGNRAEGMALRLDHIFPLP